MDHTSLVSQVYEKLVARHRVSNDELRKLSGQLIALNSDRGRDCVAKVLNVKWYRTCFKK
jgi:hypothetical protein